MGPQWGTSEETGPFACGFADMTEADRAEVASAIVGAWNILADDRCSHLVMWSPGFAQVYHDPDEETGPEEWEAWRRQVEDKLAQLVESGSGSYRQTASLLVEWARDLVEQSTGYARNTDDVQGWLDDCDAVQSWEQLSDEFIRFKFDPAIPAGNIPSGIEFASDGALGRMAKSK